MACKHHVECTQYVFMNIKYWHKSTRRAWFYVELIIIVILWSLAAICILHSWAHTKLDGFGHSSPHDTYYLDVPHKEFYRAVKVFRQNMLRETKLLTSECSCVRSNRVKLQTKGDEVPILFILFFFFKFFSLSSLFNISQ